MSAATARLTITVVDDASATIRLAGELDPATVPLLDEAVDTILNGEKLNGENSGLIIDLADVTFLDSTGLGSLIRAHKGVEPNRLVLSRPTPFALQLLTITGLDQQFEIRDA